METPIARIARWFVRRNETCPECGSTYTDTYCSEPCAALALERQDDMAW
jgi:hypothetical protein